MNIFHRRPIEVNIDDPEYAVHFKGVLARTYHRGRGTPFLESPEGINDVAEHVSKRYRRFADHVIPWIESVSTLAGAEVIEVGSGTGSATLAFAPRVRHIHSFDIAPASVEAAKARLDYFHIQNATFEGELFDPNCEFVRAGKKADVVLFVAVLEHMTFAEFETAVALAWETLRPGGIMVVAETPNRLSILDYHTSWLPFFQSLPTEVKLRYIDRSPRAHFVSDLQSRTGADQLESLVRWGRGVSYHDFEIVLGNDIHKHIIADGYEPQILPIAERYMDDELLQTAFDRLDLKVSRAFARWFLYFIARKPV